MSSDLWELRSTLDRGIARTFFTVHSGKIALLHEFIKKTHKAPANALALAKTPAQEVEVIIMAKKNVGSSIDGFLEEEGLFEGLTSEKWPLPGPFQFAVSDISY